MRQGDTGQCEHRTLCSCTRPFSFLWTCRRPGVSSPYGGLVPMCLRCCDCIPEWFRQIALLCGHVCRRGAHITMTLALCVGCASPCGVGVDRRRACPNRRDFVVLVHSMCQWCRDPLGHNGPEGLCVCCNRGRRTRHGYTTGSGRAWGEGVIRW